jgi:hypothetical protein
MSWATVVEEYQIPYMLTASGAVLYTADGDIFASADPLPDPWDEAAAGAAVWTQQSSTAATWTKVA